LLSSLTLNATNDDNFKIKFMHGVTDAPAVDIHANGSLVFENISYGKYSDYINVEANNYVIIFAEEYDYAEKNKKNFIRDSEYNVC